MSRASTKRRKLQRAKAPSTGNTNGNGNMPSYNNSMNALVAQMQAKLQPGSSSVLFSPGLPLSTIPGVNPDGIPRQYSFPLIYNTSGVDRTLGKPDIPSFAQLRMLAKVYSGITLPERVWLDMVHGLKLTIGLKPEYKAQGMNDNDPDIQKAISKILTFFEKPDKQHDQHSWLKMMIRDQTQIDEMYLYRRRTRGGKLYALEVVDGASMKPLIDDWGRMPEPPLGAYQQFPWGLPGLEYTTDDMIHYQETPQSDSPYGFGRIERFMMEVNQALRKKKRDLAMFTEGNIPAGLMEVPETSGWTPDQIDNYEQMWNALLAGNAQQQVRVKFTQPGFKYVPTDSGEILTDFDYFLYKIACGTYGISLADIGFVEDIHKSSDQGQQNMMYRRTLYPIVTVYAHNIITKIIREEFHEDRLEASFTGYEEEEDFNTQATGFQILANVGAIAPSDIAHKMGLPDVPKTGPFILGKEGPIWLKDYEEGSQLRTLQQQSQVAGLQFAASNPGGVQPDQEEDNTDETQQPTGKSQKDGSQSSKSGQSGKDTNKAHDDGKNAKGSSSKSTLTRAAESRGIDAQQQSEETGCQEDVQDLSQSREQRALLARVAGQGHNATKDGTRQGKVEPTSANTALGKDDRDGGSSNGSPHTTGEIDESRDKASHDDRIQYDTRADRPDRADERSQSDNRSVELKRWRSCALRDTGSGRNLRTFESTILSVGERTSIQVALERCSTSEDIKEVFRAAQEGQLV